MFRQPKDEPPPEYNPYDDPYRGEPNVERDAPPAIPLPGIGGRTYITYALLAVNAAIFLLMLLSGGSSNPDVLLRFGAMFGPLVASGDYWRLFTAIFLHVHLLHLLMNCLGLWIFGKLVEGVYGRPRFIALYLIAGLSGSALSYIFNRDAIAAGASGAIFGVLGALAAYFLAHRDLLGDWGRRNFMSLAVVAVINLAIGALWPGIDNWAHLGGLIGGFLTGIALAPRYRYETIPAPFGGSLRRISGKAPLGVRWLTIPAFAIAIAAMVWFGGTQLTGAEQAKLLTIQAERLHLDGDTTAALEQVERALDLAPLSPDAHFARAKIYAALGATDLALEDIGAAIRFGLAGQQREDAISLFAELAGRP